MVKHSAHLVGNILNDDRSSSSASKQFILSVTLISFILFILLFSGSIYADNGKSKGIIPSVALEDKAGNVNNNIKLFTKTEDAPRGTVKITNSYFWYIPTSTIEEITLTNNSDSCGQFCFAEKKVTAYSDTRLIDSIKFLKLQDDGTWIESSIRNYNFYIKKNLADDWVLYNYEVMPAGTYYIRLEGEKRPDWTYDWIITSQGREITDWSIWGGLAGSLLCYQETANVSTACGGLSTGNFTATNFSMVDGDWNTYGSTYYNNFSINYSVPAFATDAIWHTSIVPQTCAESPPAGTLENTSLKACFNVNPNLLNFNVSIVSGLPCLEENTLIDTPSGKVRIKDLHDGDIVFSFNNITNTIETDIIKQVMVHDISEEFNKFYVIHTLEKTIKVTGNHPIYTYENNNLIIKEARYLTDHDYLLNNKNQKEKIVKIEIISAYGKLYNLDIINNNNYFASELLTHNKGGADITKAFYNCNGVNIKNVTIADVGDICLYNKYSLFYEEAVYWVTSRGNVTLTSPMNNSAISTSNVTFNCSATVIGGATLTNMSVWTLSGGNWVRNSTIVKTGTTNTTDELSALFGDSSDSKWNCEACDSDGVCGFANKNNSFTVNFATIFNTTMTYNRTSFETKRESFTLNMTWNNNTYPLINATFIYNNTRYSTVRSGTTTNNTFFRVTIDVPLFLGANSNFSNNSFYWVVNMTDSLGISYYINSSFNNQTVKPIYFKLCNATVNRPYLNVTFRDEVSLISINQTLILSANYSITDNDTVPGTVQKAFYFDGGSDVNSSYNFCFSEPSQNLMLSTFNTRYSSILTSPSYTERSYGLSVFPLYNITTNLTLYNLCSGTGCSGLTVLFTIQDTTGTVLPDAEARITTLVGGIIPFTVGDDLTDTSGQVIFTLNSLADHVLYLNKTGCISRAITIRPTFQTYTFQMDCGNAGVPYVAPYIAPSEGLLFRVSPSTGPIFGDNLYQLRVTSTNYNIGGIRIELYDTNFTIVASSSKLVDGLRCQSQDCYMNLTFNMTYYNMAKLKGRFLVNLTGATNPNGQWYILESDAYWTNYLPSGNGLSSLNSFWKDARFLFDDWNAYGNSSDKVNLNRAEFSRVMFLFLMLAILIAAFNKFTGYDSANPGAFIGILSTIFLMGSMTGKLTTCEPGFFYLADLFGQDSVWSGGVLQTFANGNPMCNPGLFFLNNYIIALSVAILFFTYILNVNRRNS